MFRVGAYLTPDRAVFEDRPRSYLAPFGPISCLAYCGNAPLAFLHRKARRPRGISPAPSSMRFILLLSADAEADARVVIASLDWRLALIWRRTPRILMKYLREESFQIVPLKRLLQGWAILMRFMQTLFGVAGQK